MNPPPQARRWPDLIAIALLALLPILGALPTGGRPVAATLKLGPNSGSYLTGFADSYEIAGLDATRWTSYDATASLPITVDGGPVQVSWRYARVFPQTAAVDVSLGGRQIDHFDARGGRYEVRQVTLPALGRTDADVRFQVASHEGRGQGLKVDWIRIATGAGARVGLRGPAAWMPALACVVLFLLLRFAGHATLPAALLTGPWALASAIWPRLDPLAFAHVAVRVALPVMLLAACGALVLRRFEGGRWALALLIASYLIKGAGLFHPGSFYQDIQNARRFANAYAETKGGSVAQRTQAAQEQIHVGYPRYVAGKPYAFPYSVLPYAPLRLLGSDHAMEDGWRQAGVVFAALEVLLVFLLARAVTGDPAAACFAAAAAAFIPPLFSRLIIAMIATVIGHAFDVALMAAAALLVLDPKSWRKLALLGACALGSLLLYVSSLFTVSAFVVMLALLQRTLAIRLLATLVLCVAITVSWLYLPFTLTFFGEIVPALARGGTARAADTATLGDALRRIPIFYGWAYPLLTLAGFVLLRPRIDRRLYHVLLAAALAFLALLSLRAFGGGLFRDLKEITFVAPVVAVATGAVLGDVWRRGGRGRAAALLMSAGLALFGLGLYRAWLIQYHSPFVQASGFPPAPVDGGRSGR